MLSCERCGYPDDGFIGRRRERGQTILCKSCLAKPVKKIRNQFGICRPHRGAFDDVDNPLDRWGKPYRPGYRLCGHTDCIEITHIIAEIQLKGYPDGGNTR